MTAGTMKQKEQGAGAEGRGTVFVQSSAAPSSTLGMDGAVGCWQLGWSITANTRGSH